MRSASSRPEPAAPPLDAATGAAGWRLILCPAAAPALPPARLAAFAERLALLVGPAQAAAVLDAAAARHGLRLLDPARVQQARLLARRARHHQLAALRLLVAAGIEGVVLKGFDFAHRLYADPLDRIGQDLDLLLRAAELQPAVARLRAAGWSVGRLVLPAWGSIARASLAPLVSPDGATQLDLHREADEWPLPRALPAARLFAAAERFRCEELTLSAPSAEDSLLLLASNLGKDKFGPLGVRKLLDLARLLQHRELDLRAALTRARPALLARPLGTALALLADLGLPRAPGWPSAPGGAAYAGLLAELRGLALSPPPALRLLRRELRLAAGWRVALPRNLRRLRGLARRRGRD